MCVCCIDGKDEGGDRVSELWAEKPGTSKVLYRDVNFCTGLSESNAERIDIAQVKSHAPTNATQVPRVSSCASAAKVPQKQTLTAMTDWALKTEADVSINSHPWISVVDLDKL
jgi:hypothetical protein